MMTDTELDSSLDLNNLLRHVKEEMEETDLITQTNEDQNFMSMVKTEKMAEEESDLYTQQSKHDAETSNIKLEHQESTKKKEMNNFTDTDKPLSLASRLLSVSMKKNTNLCPVPIMMPNLKSPGDTLCSEVLVSQVTRYYFLK
uniref:Uncharacterized protein n=1 Tax=Biomphalaria glabrata TaxID=6526 RepID=A0A2C9M360_BIOGL